MVASRVGENEANRSPVWVNGLSSAAPLCRVQIPAFLNLLAQVGTYLGGLPCPVAGYRIPSPRTRSPKNKCWLKTHGASRTQQGPLIS
jgi:hypothetical protein